MMDNAGKKRKGGARDEIQSMVPAHKNEGKSLVLLQTRMTSTQKHMTTGWKMAESDEPTTKPERRETEDKAEEECVAATVGHISGSKPLVLLQVNCRSICNKVLEFWYLIHTYNSDVVIGMVPGTHPGSNTFPALSSSLKTRPSTTRTYS